MDICRECKKEFISGGKRVYCSRICAARANSRIAVIKNLGRINLSLLETRKCIYCGEKFYTSKKSSKKFCTRECRHKCQSGTNNPNYGHKWTEEEKQKSRERLYRTIMIGHLPIYSATINHLKLESILRNMGFIVQKEVGYGGFFVDCYLPEFHLALEADGPFHSKKRDEKRDSFLWDKFRLPILRIKGKLLIEESQKDKIRKGILSFIDKYSNSVSDRSRYSFLGEHGLIKIDHVSNWKVGKIRKFDEKNGIFYWIDKQYKRFECSVCGKMLNIPENNPRKYCSSLCANRAPRKLKRIKKVCMKCGKEFEVLPRQRDRKYCSVQCYHKCYHSWNKGLTKVTNNKLRIIGENISQTKKGRKVGKYEDYLSPEAAKKQRERIRNMKCPYCGKFVAKNNICNCKQVIVGEVISENGIGKRIK